MEKLIQLCASRNDLFGLDDAGTVYRYNFNTKAWAVLPPGSHGDADPPPDDATASAHGNGAEPRRQTRDVDR